MSSGRRGARVPIEEGGGVFETEHSLVVFDIVVEEELVDVVDLGRKYEQETLCFSVGLPIPDLREEERTSVLSFMSIVTHPKPSMSGYGSLGTLDKSSGMIGPSCGAASCSSGCISFQSTPAPPQTQNRGAGQGLPTEAWHGLCSPELMCRHGLCALAVAGLRVSGRAWSDDDM